MNPNLIKTLFVFGFGILLALLLGVSVATENYLSLFLGVIITVATATLIIPGYTGLLAIGLLSPFALPLPFIYQFPFLLFVIGICAFKYLLRGTLLHRPQTSFIAGFTVPMGFFFVWVLLRYCMNPTLPNVHGFGEDVTGFRSYLNYGMCFALLVLLGLVLRTRRDCLNLVRWLTWFSLLFVMVLAPLVFTRSVDVGNILSYLGVYVTTFDNGLLRFVVLPGFGLILLSVALLPNIFPCSRFMRVVLFFSGCLAVILGGNRSSVVMAFAIVCGVTFLKKRFVQFAGVIAVIGALLLFFNILGDRISNRAGDAGLLRIVALVNRSVAERTGADNNVVWRKLRWERAMEEIRNNPVFGKGYGGLQNAWMWTDWTNFEDARMEIDLASGGVHNGYLACALAFGVPGVLLFLVVFGTSIFVTAKNAMHDRVDPLLGELLIFVCVNLVALSISIAIGTDVNNPMIWFFMTFGVLVLRLFRGNEPAEKMPNYNGAFTSALPKPEGSRTDVAAPDRRGALRYARTF